MRGQIGAHDQQNISNDATLDLAVSASPTVIATNNAVYDITVENTGSSSGVDVSLTDPLPPSTSFVAVAGTGAFHDACRFDPVANGIACNAAIVPSGTHHVSLVVKTAKKPRTGTVGNVVTLPAGTGSVADSPASATTTLIKN